MAKHCQSSLTYDLTDSWLVSAGPDLYIRDVVPPSDAQYVSKAPVTYSVKMHQIRLGWSPAFSTGIPSICI